MRESFLTTLYDRGRVDENALAVRWGYLSQRFAWHMRQENDDGYVLLDGRSANDLVNWVIRKPPVEVPVDISQLQDSLDDMMSGK
jgi:hypothetical protein